MKKIFILLFITLSIYAQVLPVNKNITSTYQDITTDVDLLGIAESENFTIYNDSGPRIEIIMDDTGIAVIDNTFNGKGLDINSETSKVFSFKVQAKYYARAKTGNNSLIKLNKLGAVNIHDVDFHTVPFNEYFHEHTGVSTTLAVAASAGDTLITVADVTGFIVGTTFQIENGIIETTFPTATVILGNVITLDRPLDNSFLIGDTVEVINHNMAVVGSLASPVSFKLIPDKDQLWHVYGFNLSLVHAGEGDDSRFGDILPALINGVIFRAFNATVGKFRTFTAWKKNADIALDSGEIKYNTKAGGGNFGETAEGDIKIKSGAIPKINGADGDYIEILIQDDISSLVSFEVKAQGHIVGL